MDQLMIGYGVSTSTTPAAVSSSSSVNNGFNLSPISSPISQTNNQISPKKEMTLIEKQQMAMKLEKENSTTTTTTTTSSNNSSFDHLKSSKSMTDNFLNKNLVDLTSSSSNKQSNNKINNNNNNSFDFFSEFESSLPNQKLNNNRSINMNNNNNNNNNMSKSNSNQQGFFGNLALPAPPSIQNIAPPPILKPVQMATKNNTNLIMPLTSSSNSTNSSKKSALDDLNDLVG